MRAAAAGTHAPPPARSRRRSRSRATRGVTAAVTGDWRAPTQRGGPRSDQPPASGASPGASDAARGTRSTGVRRRRVRAARCARRPRAAPSGRRGSGGEHEADGERRRDRPPAAVAEYADQPCGMPGREQSLEQLLRGVDRHQRRRADQPQRGERERVARQRALAAEGASQRLQERADRERDQQREPRPTRVQVKWPWRLEHEPAWPPNASQ